MTEFVQLAAVLDEISAESGRNAKIAIVGDFLRVLNENEIQPAAIFLAGRPLSENEEESLNLSWKGLLNALRHAYEFNEEDLWGNYDGDTGEAIASLLENRTLSKQTRLISSPLSITGVSESIRKMSRLKGKGSRREREAILSRLFSEASAREARYLTAILLGDTRTGLSDGLLAEGIALAFNVPSNLVRRAWSFTGNLGEVAVIAAEAGAKGLKKVRVCLFTPVKPMLASPTDSIAEILTEENEFSFELKFDGARVQVHKDGENVKIYSRRLSDVTESLPEILELVRNDMKIDSVILDGEVVAVDENGRPYPFQVIMKRFGRVKKIEIMREKISLKLFVFDMLYHEDNQLVDLPYHKRRSLLEETILPNFIAPRIITSSIGEAEEFFQESKQLGHEGLMAKKLDSLYIPGVRGKYWFKIKHTLDTMDMVVIAAEWGYGKRANWLSDWHLAVIDDVEGGYAMVGKTFKGLTDNELEMMTDRLKSLEVGRKQGVVKIAPEIVVEILAAEVQESPTYESGLALRFARIKSIREDKVPEEAMTLSELRDVYEKQFEFKARVLPE